MRQQERFSAGGAPAGFAAAQAHSPSFESRFLWALLTAIPVYALFLFAPQVLNDGDTYWHLAAGEWMLQNRAVLRQDPFSFTCLGAPWQAHEWLSEILMGLSFRIAGWSGLVMFFGAAAALAIGLLTFHLARWLDPLPTFIVVLLAFGCMASSLLARPHILTLPILEIWTAGMLIARTHERRPSWLLLPLMTLWANLHGSFVFGLLLPLPFALEAMLDDPDRRSQQARDWLIFMVAALLAALITPHGIGGLIHPLTIMTMGSLGGIDEWRSTSFEGIAPLEIAILAALYFFLSNGVRMPAIRLVLLLALLHMALQHARHQMVFGLVGALLVAEPIAAALQKQRSTAARSAEPIPHAAWRLCGLVGLVAILGLSLVRLSLPIERADGLTSPISAVASLPPDIKELPVFNEYGLGGYLIFAGIRPFIDGRADMYGDAFVQRYFRMVLPKRREIEAAFEEYDIEWTILNPSNPAVEIMDNLPGWSRHYADEYAVIHIAAGAGAPD